MVEEEEERNKKETNRRREIAEENKGSGKSEGGEESFAEEHSVSYFKENVIQTLKHDEMLCSDYLDLILEDYDLLFIARIILFLPQRLSS